MLHIIQHLNEMWYKGARTKFKMSAVSSIKKASSKPTVKMTRRERRAQKEVAALREQSSNILPATTFRRIVTQTAADFSSSRLRFNGDAVKALQTAAEAELTKVFTGAAHVAALGKRDTVTVEDMRNFESLRNI